MDSLYVVLFTNGHIKVGRSTDPESRIAAHVDRVACMGVSLDVSYAIECANSSEQRERLLIDRCASVAKERFQSEWFAGLNFTDVCEWALDASERAIAAVAPGRWSLLIGELRAAGWTHADLARECKCGAATISRIALGQQEEPMYSVGETLESLRAASRRA